MEQFGVARRRTPARCTRTSNDCVLTSNYFTEFLKPQKLDYIIYWRVVRECAQVSPALPLKSLSQLSLENLQSQLFRVQETCRHFLRITTQHRKHPLAERILEQSGARLHDTLASHHAMYPQFQFLKNNHIYTWTISCQRIQTKILDLEK